MPSRTVVLSVETSNKRCLAHYIFAPPMPSEASSLHLSHRNDRVPVNRVLSCRVRRAMIRFFMPSTILAGTSTRSPRTVLVIFSRSITLTQYLVPPSFYRETKITWLGQGSVKGVRINFSMGPSLKLRWLNITCFIMAGLTSPCRTLIIRSKGRLPLV